MDDGGSNNGSLKTPGAPSLLVLIPGLSLGAGNTGAGMVFLRTTSNVSDKVDDEVDG